MNKSRIAVFDIDGTIFRSSLVIELVHQLVAKGIYPKTVEKEIAKEYTAWLNRTGAYEVYIEQLVRVFIKHLGGKSAAAINNTAKLVLKNQQARNYRYTTKLVKDLKQKGYFLVSISGSPSVISKAFAKALGFDETVGTELEIVKGKYTGNFLTKGSSNKHETLQATINKNHLSVDLKNSIAVGDTESDIPMLEMVGRPIAFNPNEILAKHALKKKWTIIVERKDVIYDITNKKLLSA